jgi:hypothetical protein
LVEAVARVIWNSRRRYPPVAYEEVIESVTEAYREDARLILAAIVEEVGK